MAAKDPYRYFRVEARELVDGMSAGFLALEKGAGGAEAIAKLLRLAHTLKGAARVVRQVAIAQAAHAIEEQLEPHRDGETAPDKARIESLLQLCDEIEGALRQLDTPAEATAPAKATAQPSPAKSAQTAPGEAASAPKPAPRAAERPAVEMVRVELTEMDSLLRGVAETGVQLSALRRIVSRLNEASQRTLSGAVEQVERELLQVRDTADRLRLLPASGLFASLERAVRDAAESLGKQAELRVAAQDNRLDANVLARLGEALLHVVRNAVAHGIESPAERLAAGKPALGAVELSIERRGRTLAFLCKDDGRGLDLEKIRAVAVQRGLVKPQDARALGMERAVQLLLHGGVSTTEVPDATSGRGVGLDVVRAVMEEVRGEVLVHSAPGAGTTVELRVPIALSAVSALQAVAGDQEISIPLAAVLCVLRIEESAIAVSESRTSIEYEGQSIPYLQLWRTLRTAAPDKAPGRGARVNVVIVRSEDSLTAVRVEQLLGAAELVVRPLPAMPADPIVAGASFDADGNPCLLLDPAGLALAARRERPERQSAAAARPPILVIDDSLTTRMLEQSILESAGYDVELATSAEEGLDKARVRRYGLFLVDVEMPGIDGYEFVARTQSDPVLRETPAILVTSRGSDEDKRRGKEAGARAYIVKGEFDQGSLLQTIRHLMG